MNQNSTIAKNTLVLALRMFIILFVSLYTSRTFLNILGVVDYGISNIVAGFVSMFSFLNASLANGIQRFYNVALGRNRKEDITKIYNTSLIIQGLIAFLVVAFLETGGLWYIYKKMVIPEERLSTALYLYQFSIISAVVVIFQSPFSALIIAYEKMNIFSFISVIEALLKLIFALVLQYLNYDRLLLYGLFYMIITIFCFALNFIYCKMSFKELCFMKLYSRNMFKDMISFSGWNILGTFACIAREQGLNIVLNLFFGPAVNAARGVAYQVSSALQGFVSNLSVAAKPQMVQSYAIGESYRTINLMYITSKMNFIFLFVLSVPIMLNIDYILNIWLGDMVPMHASNFVILIVVINFVNNFNSPLSNIVYATGKMKNYEIVFSTINLLIIPFSFITLQFGYPPEFVFVVYLIMTVVVQIGCLISIKNIVTISLRYYVCKLILPLVISVCLSMPIIYLMHCMLPKSIIGLCLEYIMVTLVSSVIFYFISLDKSEKKMAINIVEKMINKFGIHKSWS